MRKTSCLIVLASVLSPLAAEGAAQTHSHTLTFTPWYQYPFNFSLPQFDPMLGELDSVILELEDGLASTTIDYHNNNGPHTGFKYHEDNTFYVHLNNNIILQQSFSFETPNYNLPAPAGLVLPGAGGSYSQTWTQTLSAATITYTNPADLAIFTGLNLAPVSTGIDNIGGIYPVGKLYTFDTSSTASITAKVLYNYTPIIIPEPTTITLSLALASLLPFVRPARQR